MTIEEFHASAECLIESFDAGEISYEEFDEGYEVLLEQLGDDA